MVTRYCVLSFTSIGNIGNKCRSDAQHGERSEESVTRACALVGKLTQPSRAGRPASLSRVDLQNEEQGNV
ncbi:unnamed protein product [Protopolystoma xenopodis]|uniref:Uncharacterized protein n=1 Tax=Protopolystoma xenopodis TaxID=117903 RepID=A0A3S5CQ58_9PLAT|nr:unnamed protein product [Protopolystoma xenopodis]